MIPLIFTSKGNLPIDSLRLETNWDIQDGYSKFSERYRDEAGDIVRESAHVYDRRGVFSEGEAAQIG